MAHGGDAAGHIFGDRESLLVLGSGVHSIANAAPNTATATSAAPIVLSLRLLPARVDGVGGPLALALHPLPAGELAIAR